MELSRQKGMLRLAKATAGQRRPPTLPPTKESWSHRSQKAITSTWKQPRTWYPSTIVVPINRPGLLSSRGFCLEVHPEGVGDTLTASQRWVAVTLVSRYRHTRCASPTGPCNLLQRTAAAAEYNTCALVFCQEAFRCSLHVDCLRDDGECSKLGARSGSMQDQL